MAPKVSSAHTHDTPQRNRRAGPFACPDERNAMAEVAVQVPAQIVPRLRETVVLLYRATLEALQLSLGACGGSGEDRREVQCHRRRLARLDRLLEQVGWPGDPVAEAVRLSAPSGLLQDALRGALIDAGERLSVAGAARRRGEASAASVRAAAAEVIALDRLVREVEPKGGR
jgi:hypothetical protein